MKHAFTTSISTNNSNERERLDDIQYIVYVERSGGVEAFVTEKFVPLQISSGNSQRA